MIPHNDEAGKKHCKLVINQLLTVAKSIRVLELPNLKPKGDVSDWLEKEGSKETILKLADSACDGVEWIRNFNINEIGIGANIANSATDHANTISESSRISTLPLPLFRSASDPQPYPFNALGSFLGPAAQITHSILKSPDGICGQSFLAAAALAVQGHKNVEIDGRTIPLSLNLISIAESGERKSPTDKIALKAIRKFEEDLHTSYLEKINEFLLDKAIYEQKKSEAIRKSKSIDEAKDSISELGEAPIRPLNPTIITEEPTYEGIVTLLDHGYPSVGLFSDEGGRFLGGFSMSSENKQKTLSGLSELWDSKRISRTRVGAGAKLIYGKRVSLHLLIQPNIAQTLLSDQLAIEQGYLNRALISYPQLYANPRVYNDNDVCKSSELVKYYNAIERILSRHLPLKKDTLNVLEPSSLFLSEKAKKSWINFYNAIEQGRLDGGEYFQVRNYVSKSCEQSLRIAGVLTLVKNPDSSLIEEDDMECSIQLVRFYIDEFKRLMTSGHNRPNLDLAAKLLSWIKKKTLNQIYLQKVYQLGPNNLRDSETAKKAIAVLEDHGWLFKSDPIEIDGSLRNDVWGVHPYLFEN